MEWLLIVVLLAILGAEFVNGWTDAPNAIATVVSTNTLSPRLAVLWATIFNIAGVMSGTAVAATIGSGIVDSGVINLETVFAAMIAIIVWSTVAAYFGIPTSESHALVASLAGSALAIAGPEALLSAGWQKVLIGLGFSTFLGFFGAFVITKIIQITCANASPAPSKRIFSWLQILSSGFMAWSHGLNDGQKFIGVFALALVLGGVSTKFSIPFWVILLCAGTMGLGTSLGGMRIIRTIGVRMVGLESWQGFGAETAAAGAITLASTT